MVQSSDESEQTSDYVESKTSTTSENVTFVDSQVVAEDTSYRKVPIISSSISDGTSLARFLSRPTLIKTHTWSTSQTVGNVSVDAQIKPWSLLANDSVIKNKLQNYAFFRGKLCLKFVVNGTPFHYGAYMISHEPNTGHRASRIAQPSVVANDVRLATPYSQLPHVTLYPADNASAELHLPFFTNRSWLSIPGTVDFVNMGTLYYYILSPLRVASSSASSSVTIQTYAWFDEVELTGSTSAFALQSGDFSSTCDTIADAGSKIATATAYVCPEISAGATAISEHASKAARAAEALGFCNLPITEDVRAYTPMPFSQMSTSEISTAVQKLTLSPSQGVSIDPQLVGMEPKDEMAMSYILQKPSILTVAHWSTTEIIGHRAFGAAVSPSLFNLQKVGSPTKCYTVNHTYMSYLQSMFTYWRGDIIFDIDIICTKFHKGRLLVQWDPVLGGSVKSVNTVYSTIIDIGETNKVSIRIPFHQRFEFLRARGIIEQTWVTTDTDVTPYFDYDNGVFYISVLTPLVSPITPSSVDIVISVRGAENLELIDPCSQLGETAASVPPSFFPIQSKDTVELESTTVTLGDKGSFHKDRHLLNFAEPIVSLRAVLRRYSMYDVSMPTYNDGDTSSSKGTATQFLRFIKSYSHLSPGFGYDPKGMLDANKIVGSGTAKYTCTNTHPMLYISMMYGGYRGGTNFIINASDGMYSSLVDTRVQRITTSAQGDFALGKTFSIVNSTASRSSTLAWLNKEFTQHEGGSTYTNDKINPSLSFYLPFMNQYAFNYPNAATCIGGNDFDGSHRTCALVDSIIRQDTANTSCRMTTFTCFAGAGADFTTFYLLCCPTVFYYASFPVVP